jgi:hypothetical protein
VSVPNKDLGTSLASDEGDDGWSKERNKNMTIVLLCTAEPEVSTGKKLIINN